MPERMPEKVSSLWFYARSFFIVLLVSIRKYIFSMPYKKIYSLREEKANYLTHAFGVAMVLVAAVLLFKKAIAAENNWALFSYSVFIVGMLTCMLSSTIYHYIQKPNLKAFIRHFDHGSIYLLIASSYSPFTLILLRNEGYWGWGLFALVWVIAIVGIAFSFRKLKANNHFKTASYVLMGLVVVIAIKPLINVATALNCVDSLLWLAAGGVLYIVGSLVYALAKKEYSHTVFHVFVLLGLASHIVAALKITL
jgi:hemolysin III